MRFLTLLNNAARSVERIDFVDFLNGAFRSRVSAGALTADQTLTAPDKSGIIAITTDVMIEQGAAVTVTAVPNIDWAIPAGVRCITFVADQVVIPGSSLLRFAVAGTFVATGYASNSVYLGSGYGANPQATSGLHVPDTSTPQSSTVRLVRVGSTNTWLSTGSSMYGADMIILVSGRVALAGAATSIRFLPPSGNFTAGGKVQVMWEF